MGLAQRHLPSPALGTGPGSAEGSWGTGHQVVPACRILSVTCPPPEGPLSLGLAEGVQGSPWCDRAGCCADTRWPGAVPQGQGVLWGPVCWVCLGARVGLTLYHLCSLRLLLSAVPNSCSVSLSLQMCLLQGEDCASDVPGILTARALTLAALGFLKLWFSNFCYKILSLSFLLLSLLGLFSVQILLVSGGCSAQHVLL